MCSYVEVSADCSSLDPSCGPAAEPSSSSTPSSGSSLSGVPRVFSIFSTLSHSVKHWRREEGREGGREGGGGEGGREGGRRRMEGGGGG